nr:MAG TPA: hypothetical protein [Caudoviricetes sp.]
MLVRWPVFSSAVTQRMCITTRKSPRLTSRLT